MKVIKPQYLLMEPERSVKFNAGISERILLAKDGMGFSVHRTVMKKGGPYHWHYKNHLEACYCISGLGYLTDLATGNEFVIEPGDCYVLDSHDDHTFEILEDIVLISIFNPPCKGTETHNQDGSYDS